MRSISLLLCGIATIIQWTSGASAMMRSPFEHSVREEEDEPCLCIFDVDRTLTGKQGLEGSRCPRNHVTSIFDDAYGGGNLTISAFAQQLNESFCAECFIGVISAGDVGSGETLEEAYLFSLLNVSGGLISTDWSVAPDFRSPLITRMKDGTKQDAVSYVIDYYTNRTGTRVSNERVFFFDDRESNVRPFAATAYNARQISCDTRDAARGGPSAIGLCGATPSEIRSPLVGVHLCNETRLYH